MSLFISPASPMSGLDLPIIVSTDSEQYSPFPYLTSVNLSYTKPVIGFYENLDTDPRVHKRMIKYFFYKTLDKWLLEDLIDILNYFKIKGGNVDLLTSLKEYDPTAVEKESDADIQKKIEFIEKFILTKSTIAKILHNFVTQTGTRWVDLPKNDFFIKQVLEDKLTKMLKQLIVEREMGK